MAYKPAARGYRGEMLVGMETEFGKLPADAKGWQIPFNTESLTISRAKNTAATLRGTRNPAEPFDGNTAVDGDLVVPVDTGTFGLWLALLFGAPESTQQGGETLYKHVFKSGEELPSFWLETMIATQTPIYKRSLGCKINTLALEAGGDGELTATLGLMAASQTQESTAAVAAPEEMPFNRLANCLVLAAMATTRPPPSKQAWPAQPTLSATLRHSRVKDSTSAKRLARSPA